MKIIKAKMELDQHKNKDTNRGTGSKPQYIDNGIRFLTDDIPPGRFEKNRYHSKWISVIGNRHQTRYKLNATVKNVVSMANPAFLNGRGVR
jgi:hypothetical protein